MKLPEHPKPVRMLEFSHRFHLDLPDSFPRDGELLAYFIEGMVPVNTDAKSHAYDHLLSGVQRCLEDLQ